MNVRLTIQRGTGLENTLNKIQLGNPLRQTDSSSKTNSIK